MDRLKKHLVQIVLGLLLGLVFLGHAGRFYQIPLVSVLDAFIYDARLRLTMPGGVDDRIVILDIDEKSLAEGGRWPWGRDKMAALVDRLFDHYGIAVLGFDVVFAEPDDSSGLRSLESLAKKDLRDDVAYQNALKGLRTTLDYDRRFAESMAKRPVVLGYYFTNLSDALTSGKLPEPALPPGTFKGRNLALTSWSGYGANLPVYQANAATAGHFVPLVDFDGISRRVPMLVEYQGAYYESLSLAMVRLLLGMPSITPGYADDSGASSRHYAGLEWLELPTQRGSVRIPVDESAATLIPYRGTQGSFRYLPISDALHGRLPVEALKGKIVIVGTTTPGLMDLRATPVATTYPGVEIHANLVAGMLDGNIKLKPAYVLGAEVLIIMLCGLLLALLLPLFSPMKATLLALCVLVTVTLLNLWLWVSAGLLLPLASTLLMIIALYALSMSWGYFVESRTKRQLTGLFGQYVPPELVEVMSRDPENYSMAGRKAELTVLFSDVRGFTTISEGLEPDELATLMNEYLGAMTAVVRNNRGTLDKYIGDAIMAFWGAPVSDADHARHAVMTALDMQRELRKLDEPFKARGWPVLHIGVGVNTGTMTVGDMGSPVRQSYTVMGDAVNLGSRLEGITKQYGVGIIVGETTRALLKEDFVFRELDRVRVKGKAEPVGIYEPLGLVGDVDKAALEALKLWQQALRLYRAQEWDQADVQIYNLSRQAPDCYLYQLYAKRIALYRQNPPGEGWDGVTTFETK